MSEEIEQLPALVLGILPSPARREYKFRPGLEWREIQHQTSGHACGQMQIIGTVLPIRPEKLADMKGLCDKWLESDLGCFGVSLDDLNAYRADLKLFLGVDCNVAYPTLQEAWYPVDVEFIRSLTPEILPEKLDDLILWESEMARFFGCIGRWSLVILGENCD